MSKTNDIQMFLHCKNCLNKRPANDKKEYIISPREWVHLEVGFTKKLLMIVSGTNQKERKKKWA